jgi:cob(I)alamin adenosyltransferase
MKIYTKTGDTGNTSLLGGKRVSKAHIRINAYGTVDELNSHIGLLRDLELKEERRAILKEIQDRLFTIGAHLAADDKNRKKIPDLLESDVELLEKEIDKMNEELPPMKHFILQGGHQFVSFAHIARCVCRRAEREIITLHLEEGVEELIIKYVNRLSDYLFVLARKLGKELNAEEVAWKPRL